MPPESPFALFHDRSGLGRRASWTPNHFGTSADITKSGPKAGEGVRPKPLPWGRLQQAEGPGAEGAGAARRFDVALGEARDDGRGAALGRGARQGRPVREPSGRCRTWTRGAQRRPPLLGPLTLGQDACVLVRGAAPFRCGHGSRVTSRRQQISCRRDTGIVGDREVRTITHCDAIGYSTVMGPYGVTLQVDVEGT